ncbi:thioredoxin [Facklamia miroungae]|uniref:Thioredoxin n=1 Tax=Facklamia miroungae TaxID=120956 RepID=A0A1G7QWY9_9LACT|nr:thioredoxin [Facklamia miroungae]NKZ29095.1 thioredoxin [Facklamia miroungae]SDG03022.1 thioredoxin 1 [Facklamia miroungae]
MVKAITDTEFKTETAQGVSIIDFWAPWCGPCRMQSPIIDELSQEMEGQIDFFKMNVDEETKIAGEFGIMSIPTMIIKKDGQVVEKLVGFHDKERLSEILKKYI